jgi:hypothetical protein
MADPQRVARAVRAMAVAHRRQFKNDEEEAMGVAAFAHAVKSYSDDAVNRAANEWVATMKWFPTVVEFSDLTRKHQNALTSARALDTGGTVPMLRPPVGKPGSEGLAADIVIKRMMRAVAEQSPQGFFGRLVYGSNDKHAEVQSVDGREQRTDAYAAIAFEQAVNFEDSSVTWDAWDGEAAGDVLRRCRNALCDHGWIETTRPENDRLVTRLTKCEDCGGPKQ